jgi:DNA-binding IclR family transcriptional regulator
MVHEMSVIRGTGSPHTPEDASWTFLTNHAHVLMAIASDPNLRVRDLADRVGITERAALRILGELEASAYLERHRIGRRTSYRLRLDQPMRHPMERTHPIRALVEALAGSDGEASQGIDRLERDAEPD